MREGADDAAASVEGRSAGGAAVAAASSPWWMVAEQPRAAGQEDRLLAPAELHAAGRRAAEAAGVRVRQAGRRQGERGRVRDRGQRAVRRQAGRRHRGRQPARTSTRLYESNVAVLRGGRAPPRRQRPRWRRCAASPRASSSRPLTSVVYKGRAMGVPLAVNPWPVHARMDLLEQAKVEYPRRGTSSSRRARRSSRRRGCSPSACAWACVEDTTDNVMNLLWCYGGKMVEADNKTVVMNSPENVAGVKMIEAMFKTHKIIPPGAISWDNSGNNKAYQSKQAAFVMNPSSIYAYLDGNDKDLQKVDRALSGAGRAQGHGEPDRHLGLRRVQEEPVSRAGQGPARVPHAAGQLRQDHPVHRRPLGAGLQAALRQPVLEGEAGLHALHQDGRDRRAGQLCAARRRRRPARC